MGYKCYQWRVKNLEENTEISYWVAEDNFMFFEELEILGKKFENVYTYENVFDPDAVKMFYNQKYGIVSFIDKTGKQWVIND